MQSTAVQSDRIRSSSAVNASKCRVADSQRVVALAANQHIRSASPNQRIVSSSSVEKIRGGRSGDCVCG